MKNIIILSFVPLLFSACGGDSSSSSSDTSVGQSGSMARFAISGNHLYTINQNEMNILDIKEASTPKKVNKIRVPFDVETLFSYKDTLYVGSSSGMYIYDNSTPTQPTRMVDFTHAQSCDPVVVSDDVAFVTLHTSLNCWRETGVNRLEIVDVKIPSKPRLIRAIDMYEPKGLGVDGNNLFICDGRAGLKVFDINKTDSNGTIDVKVVLKETLGEIDCYDVIAHNDNLIISNSEDIRQFDYTSFPMREQGRVK